jgi:hypothetical protein
MADIVKDVKDLFHFRELHLFPRVIFFLGLIFLIGSFFVKSFILGFLGVSVVLCSVTLNLFIDWTGSGELDEWWPRNGIVLFQFLLSFAITLGVIYLNYHYYRYGQMPPPFQPLSDPH